MGAQRITNTQQVRRLLAGLATAAVLGGGSLATATTATPAAGAVAAPAPAASASTPTAPTAPTAQAAAPAAAPGVPLVRGARRIARIRAYWTAARMRAAIPLGAARPVRARTTGLTPNTLPTGAGHVRVPTSVGKLFFTDRRTDYVCSAAAIASPKGDEVLTAGHCVHTGPHPDGGLLGTGLLAGPPRYYSNWVFVPRYADGRAPLGRWVATGALAAAGWIKRESFTEDQGILTVARLGGRRLTDVVGGNRVALGRGRHQKGVRIWGWPAESPYDGEKAWRCDGTTKPTSIAAPGDAGMTCGLNGGASGGPWFLPKGRTGRTGTIFAVTSRITVGGSSHVVLAHPLPLSLRALIAAAG